MLKRRIKTYWCKEDVNLKREVTGFSDWIIIFQLLFLLSECAIETLLETLIQTGKYYFFHIHKALRKTSARWTRQNKCLTFQKCFEKLLRTSFEGPSVSRVSLMNNFWWHNCPQKKITILGLRETNINQITKYCRHK